MSRPAPAILALHPNGAETLHKNGAPHPGEPAPVDACLARGAIPGLHLTASMWLGLRHLLKAHDTAHELNRPKWEFAVELETLERAGCDRNDLRALICARLVEHGLETTPARLKRRSFRRTAGLRLTPASCFVLSDWGLAISSHRSAPKAGGDEAASPPAAPSCSLQPVWDPIRHELRLGQVVLKRFRQPAKNQQAILAAFEEDGWPPHIDNPIPGGEDENAQDRLHDAVKRLNRQIKGLLRFECDGTGEGVVWHVGPRSET
jgi:hypothetical protein